MGCRSPSVPVAGMHAARGDDTYHPVDMDTPLPLRLMCEYSPLVHRIVPLVPIRGYVSSSEPNMRVQLPDAPMLE